MRCALRPASGRAAIITGRIQRQAISRRSRDQIEIGMTLLGAFCIMVGSAYQARMPEFLARSWAGAIMLLRRLAGRDDRRSPRHRARAAACCGAHAHGIHHGDHRRFRWRRPIRWRSSRSASSRDFLEQLDVAVAGAAGCAQRRHVDDRPARSATVGIGLRRHPSVAGAGLRSSSCIAGLALRRAPASAARPRALRQIRFGERVQVGHRFQLQVGEELFQRRSDCSSNLPSCARDRLVVFRATEQCRQKDGHRLRDHLGLSRAEIRRRQAEHPRVVRRRTPYCRNNPTAGDEAPSSIEDDGMPPISASTR